MLGQRRYHAVLCDLKLPSMNGVELMECIRQEFPEVAFVMVTERSDIRHGILAMISGADGYIHPPLAPCAIVASLDRALKRKRIESALAKHGQRSGLCGTSLKRTP
jgi:DNA-binding NarL/FixJ family response regulator